MGCAKVVFQAVVVVALAIVAAVFVVDTDHFRLFPSDDSSGIIALFQHSSSGSGLSETVQDYDVGQDDVAHKAMDSQEDASRMVNNYYNLATDFYEYGWGTSFHFAHTATNESHADSMKRHEHRVAEHLGVKASDRVLDVGCGVGGPAREIARFSGAHVTGITLNAYQVERAKIHTKNEGMEGKVEFKQMDFTKTEFADASFDNAYAIESTCHAHQLEDVYAEAYRVLKPGGKFFIYEWIKAAGFDGNNAEHLDILRDIEYGNGLPPLRTLDDVKKAAKTAGFVIEKEHDLAQDSEGVRSWWFKMQEARNWAFLTHAICWVTETFGLAPAGTFSAHKVMLAAARGLVRGGDSNAFTPMHLVLLVKPE